MAGTSDCFPLVGRPLKPQDVGREEEQDGGVERTGPVHVLARGREALVGMP